MKIQFGIERIPLYGIKQRVCDPDAIDETESTSLDEFEVVIFEEAWEKAEEMTRSR
jgi:hypothetical protein